MLQLLGLLARTPAFLGTAAGTDAIHTDAIAGLLAGADHAAGAFTREGSNKQVGPLRQSALELLKRVAQLAAARPEVRKAVLAKTEAWNKCLAAAESSSSPGVVQAVKHCQKVLAEVVGERNGKRKPDGGTPSPKRLRV